MKQFRCPTCRERVLFERERCRKCGTDLMFDPRQSMMRALSAPCANRALIGCNWIAGDGGALCACCELTRTIPDLGSARNVILWKKVEQAKRRLLYDLDRLGLPTVFARGPGLEQGPHLAFDILSEETAGHPIMTGHADGLITLNLAEADDAEREARRIALREGYRTLLGHVRHEVGHFYWDMLVAQSNWTIPFRAVFGDERADYQLALAAYHDRADRTFDPKGFISEYATSHPWEDWAETFAHFLHIVSTLDSAASLPLALGERARHTLADPYLESDFEALLWSWTPLADSLNELNRSVGQSEAYPFELSPAVKGKLHFVHMVIARFRNGRRRTAAPHAAADELTAAASSW
ncbi:MAG: putative zinc-binding metallopeptidase [Bradyrhizobium sp.]|uniref:zinc-binding metallopeptidase family protein n=1 Tax=Bradyrhizobium sp. TaxID=376 RepID=UPI001D5A83DA|nr:putative zinc-binding metallopeptidase [Bradyrhizobium sp.]MBV9562368.1 putative zinc-binding metallopeptidase [Bradyrhizobium sp.]